MERTHLSAIVQIIFGVIILFVFQEFERGEIWFSGHTKIITRYGIIFLGFSFIVSALISFWKQSKNTK